MAETDRDAQLARTANLLAAGGTIRSVAEALGVGRTAAHTLVREVRARTDAPPPFDPRRAAAEAVAAVTLEEAAAAAFLDGLAQAAAERGDVRGGLAVAREQRLLRAARMRSAAALAEAAPQLDPRAGAIEAASSPA